MLNFSAEDQRINRLNNGPVIHLNIYDASDTGEYSCVASNLAGNRVFYKDVTLYNASKKFF
jgi:hypothetical protein